mgnify:CR=1 FL=1
MGIFRRCPKCKELFSGKQCTKCAAKRDKKWRSKIEAMQIYSKRRWKDCRRDVRLKWMDYDIWALGGGRLVKVDERVVVHHIYERDDRPDLVYDIDNLITVSYDSHAEIHKQYETDRPAALARIRAGIEKFKEMFGDGS